MSGLFSKTAKAVGRNGLSYRLLSYILVCSTVLAMIITVLQLAWDYRNDVAVEDRSRMNVPFFLPDDALNDAFVAGAKSYGLLQLRGHKSVGGMRASIYNAMPIEGVQALIACMRDFERTGA